MEICRGTVVVDDASVGGSELVKVGGMETKYQSWE